MITTNDNSLYVTGRNYSNSLFGATTGAKVTYASKVQADKKILTAEETNSENETGIIVDTKGYIYAVGYNAEGEIGVGYTRNLSKLIRVTETKMLVKKNIINIVKGSSANIGSLTFTIKYNLLTDTINGKNFEYKSLDNTIATVDGNGTVTAVGIGTTYITIHNTENNLYASVKINVNYDKDNNVTEAKVEAGNNHFIALKSNGTAYTWGYNGYGQLGTGDGANRLTMTPVKINGEVATDIIDVAAATNHTLVLRKDGTVWSAGDDYYGVLGNSTDTNDNGGSGNTTTFNQVLNSNDPTGYLQNVIAIATSDSNSYALTSDGEVYGWGRNRQGQLGIGGTTGGYNGLGVNKVQGIEEVMQISTGYLYLEMLKADGTVWGVGLNDYGELGTNDTGYRTTATQMLNADGTALTGVKEISASNQQTLVLKEDGTVYGVGYNGYGQLGTGNTATQAKLTQVLTGSDIPITNAKHINTSNCATMITTEDNSLYVTGRSYSNSLFGTANGNVLYASKVQEDKKILTAEETDSEAETGAIVDTEGYVIYSRIQWQRRNRNWKYSQLYKSN